MYRESFPKCVIDGDQTPSGMLNHMGDRYAIPKKCLTCKFSFEGECTRSLQLKDGYLRLDTGFCGYEGSTEPELIKKTPDGNEIFVPKKCVACKHLHSDEFRGYVCMKDKEKWGSNFRDLDWGDWEPTYPNVGIGQAIITKEVVEFVLEGKKIKALKLYRALNKIETLLEAKMEIDKLEIKLKEFNGEQLSD